MNEDSNVMLGLVDKNVILGMISQAKYHFDEGNLPESGLCAAFAIEVLNRLEGNTEFIEKFDGKVHLVNLRSTTEIFLEAIEEKAKSPH